MGRLFLLFTVVPLVELYLLITIGRFLGVVPTIALVLITGALGAWFARLEGLRVVRQWQEAIAQQRLPKDGLVDGVLIFVGGVLLITPGVLTDVAGLCMVWPPTRRVIGAVLRRWVERQVAEGKVRVVATQPPVYRSTPYGPRQVIEVESEVIDVVDREDRPPPRNE